jgi:hypothetical protein
MVIKDLQVERSHRDSGQIIILTALSMTAMLAIAALSIDVSFMYDKRNQMAAAADAAAKSAAIEVYRQGTGVALTRLQAFANEQVVRHGFSPTTTTTVTVNHAPTSGDHVGDLGYVEVIVSEVTSTMFGRILGWVSMTPGARAVAGISNGLNCLITLGGPTASPESLSLGNSTLNLTNCNVAVNGDFDGTNPNATVNAPGTSVVGACLENCSHVQNLTTGAGATSDPLSLLPAPTDPGGCTAVSVPTNSSLTIPAGCYTSITLGNNANLYLGTTGGVYYIKGLITAGNSPHICLNAACTLDYSHGVMIYLTGAGQIDLPNGSTLALNAMTSGPYTGILFYQDPADTNYAHFRNGSSDYNLSGAMYFPTADVEFGNASSANDCSLLVVKSLTMNNGTSAMSNTCSAYGGSPLKTVAIVE